MTWLCFELFWELGGNPPSVFSPTQYYGTFADIAATAGAGLLAPSGSVTSLATQGHQQSSYSYNFNIQQQLWRSNLLEIGYAGSIGRHQLWQRNINAVPLGSNFLNLNPQNRDTSVNNTTTVLPTNFLRPYQGWGDILLYEFSNSSNYHSLQTSFQHRMKKGVSFSSSYTFSKALDASDAYSNAIDPFLSPRVRNYGRAGFDRNHVFNSSFTLVLPKPFKNSSFKPAHWVTSGWELLGVIRLNSGGPFTPGYALLNGITSPTGSTSSTARVQVVNPDAPYATRFAPPPQPAGKAMCRGLPLAPLRNWATLARTP